MNDIQIKCFLTAAKSRSFSEAAGKLFMTPSTFGRHISSLESELGYPLFSRDWKGLRLTSAGEFMCAEVPKLIHQFKQLQTEALRLSTGASGQLSIGILEGQRMDEHLRSILRYFHQNYPELQLQLHRYDFRELEKQLHIGTLDLGITLSVEFSKNENLHFRPYQSLKNYIVLPKEHPLKNYNKVGLSDFANDTFLELEEGACLHISKMLTDACKHAGFAPNLFVCPDLTAQMFALEAGIGIMVLNENHIALHNPHLVIKELTDFPNADFCVAWHRSNQNPAVHAFLTLI